jgi:hypothetical protein
MLAVMEITVLFDFENSAKYNFSTFYEQAIININSHRRRSFNYIQGRL